MDLVVDANILFAGMIKDNLTAELLFNERLHLFAPEFLFMEFKKYEDLILKKTARSKEDFDRVISLLKRRIDIYPFEDFKEYLDQGVEVSPDENDSQYFALALCLGASIWSNDKDLKNQEMVKVYSTSELIHLLRFEE
jgi:predicted nucleic acid-binding protein